MVIITRQKSDGSIHSTVSCEARRKPIDPEEQRPVAPIVKQVAFAQVTDEFFGVALDHKKVTAKQLWYTKTELKGFSKSLMKKSRTMGKTDARKKGETFGNSLERAYDLCYQAESHISDAHFVKDCPHQRQLRKFAATETTLGLEKYAVPTLCREAQMKQTEMLRAVKKLQSMQVNEDVLRQKCEEISRPGRLFAAILAHVQVQG